MDPGRRQDDPLLPFEQRAARRARELWQRYGEIPKRWLVFAAVVVAAAILDERFNSLVNRHLAGWTAWVTAGVLELLGVGGRQEGTLVVSSYCVFEIIGECTAYYPCAIFAAAVLAYPCKLSRRVLGLVLGIPLLLLINQARLVSLCYVYRWSQESFETIHMLVWQSLIIFFTVLLWVLWVSTLGREHAARSA